MAGDRRAGGATDFSALASIANQWHVVSAPWSYVQSRHVIPAEAGIQHWWLVLLGACVDLDDTPVPVPLERIAAQTRQAADVFCRTRNVRHVVASSVAASGGAATVEDGVCC